MNGASVWSVGQRIRDYEILAKLRDGGMATLYLARRTGEAGFRRHVAIKVIHPDLADDDKFRQMFLDEALLSSRIQHPNVVQVEELGRFGAAHFLVMEFVHGCSLSQLQRALHARGRRLSPSFAVRIAMHVADGLHAAHETRDDAGRLLTVVHRDVTPENVLLAYAGHVKLIDFGIAKAYGRRHHTVDGLVKGKFRYMAPEQALGQTIDRRVDIYQLGIVLWEMLTLRRLFDADNDVALMASVQRPRVAPPSTLVDRIPQQLELAVMCALDPNPNNRPADAQVFARMLARAVPEAHEVDTGALRSLLAAIMQDQRQHERSQYPVGVYERLDRQLETQPVIQESGRAPEQVLLRHTLNMPSGADDRPGLDGVGATQPGTGATRGLAESAQYTPRPRRFVQFTGELRTAWTSASEPSRRAWKRWLVVGGALALAAVLALLTLALRPRRRVVPPPPPLPTVQGLGVHGQTQQPAIAPHPFNDVAHEAERSRRGVGAKRPQRPALPR